MSTRRKPGARLAPKPVVEELEPRLLLSAGIEGALFTDAAHADVVLESEPLPPAVAAGAASVSSTHGAEEVRQELVFVDAATPDAARLVAALQSNAAGDGRQLDVVLLEDGQGIVHISQILTARGDLDAIHIISHGSDGALQLGGERVDASRLDALSASLRGWSDALAEDADILLYGCNLGASDAGQSFVVRLAALTGADVAASDDLTGHAQLGGDWDLEIRRGEIESDGLAAKQLQESWRGTLATVTFQEGVGGYAGTQDTELRGSSPNNSYGSQTFIDVQGNPGSELQGLLRFDGLFGSGPGQIPLGSTITAASLTIEGFDETTFDITFHRMLQAWSEASTFNSLSGGIQADDIEASATPDATLVSPAATTHTLSGLEATLQAWSNGDTNYGWAILSSGTNDFGLLSSETGTVSERPLLQVTYVAPTTEISGTILEDVDGDGALADAVGAAGVTVDLYVDDGDGVIDAGDTLSASVPTDGSGNYSFAGVGDGTYWVVVDSTTIAASAGYNVGFSDADVWAEQTYGTVGAVTFDGSYSYLGSAGALYGGMQGEVADDANALISAEHVTRAVVAGADVTGVDSAFSFNVVSRTGDGDVGPGNRTLQGSLRQFIGNSNAISGTQSSQFVIDTSDSGYNGSGNGEFTFNIQPGWDAYLTDTVILDAATQAGYSGTPIIEIDMSAAGFQTAAFALRANDSLVRGFLVHGSLDEGIEVDGSTGFGDNNTIQNNWIGLNASGAMIGNGDNGFLFAVDAVGNTFGGTGPNDANIVVGSGSAGVMLRSTGTDNNVVEGNYIGVGQDGVTAMPNVRGLVIEQGASNNRVGGATAATRNVISGNNDHGVVVWDAATTLNQIAGNYIGLDASGTVAVANQFDGVYVGGDASGNTIGGSAAGEGNVISGNLDDGIEIGNSNTAGNAIFGNFIGTNAAGTAPVGNGRHGVVIYSGANNTQIGGAGANEGNLVSGNAMSGIVLDGNLGTTTVNNTVQGNRIGTNAAGNAAIANGDYGIHLFAGARNNLIGGAAAGEDNLISGNGNHGIYIQGTGTSNNAVQGNLIGTDLGGTAALGNGAFGLWIVSGADNTTVGGSAAGEGNVVAASGGLGVAVTSADGTTIRGNFIGTDVSGTVDLGNLLSGVAIQGTASNNDVGGINVGDGNVIANNGGAGVLVGEFAGTGNSILRNSIYANAQLGIDLVEAGGITGVTGNDALDADGGANGLQNFPLLISSNTDAAGNVYVAGTMRAAASTTYRVEFFGSLTADASGHGQGQIYLGFVDVTTDGSGEAEFSVLLGATLPAGYVLSTTATAPDGSTSEFSANVGAKRMGVLTVDTSLDSVDGNVTSITNLLNDRGADNRISLREAILATNATANAGLPDEIHFNLLLDDPNRFYYQDDGTGGALTTVVNTTLADADIGDFDPDYPSTPATWFRIQPTSALPSINDALIIDGFTQDGASANTLAVGSDAVMKIVIDGALSGNSDGFVINAAGSGLHGLVITGNFASAIIVNAANVDISGNYIGTDVTGTLAGIALDTGVTLNLGASNVTVGGPTAAARNVISGTTQEGIVLTGATTHSNTIEGNYIGTTAQGDAPVANASDGIALYGGTYDNVIRGNVISGNDTGVVIDGIASAPNNNLIAGNLIGTDAAGAFAVANSVGVYIRRGATNTTVGGTSASERNVISGNSLQGILVEDAATTGTTIQGNYLGVDAGGSFAIANIHGIEVDNAVNTHIGGTAAGAGNAISGNTVHGVYINGASTSNTQLQGNIIGLDAAGNAAVANGFDGIRTEGGASNVTIGGATAAHRNVISGNAQHGIQINSSSNVTVQGNFIGTDISGTLDRGNLNAGIYFTFGTSASQIGGVNAGEGNVIAFNGWDGITLDTGSDNTFLGNSIYSNAELGIDIGNDGVTAGAPALTAADTDTAGTVNVDGSFSGAASTTYRIEFFATATGDASGFGEGQIYLGFADVTTDGSGNATFSATVSGSVPVGYAIAATATGPTGNTTEFSAHIAAVLYNAPPVVTPSGDSVIFTEDGAAVSVDPSITVSDSDSATLTGMTIRITNYVSGQDLLSFTNQLGIVHAWDSVTGTLTLSGSASVSDYQAALRTVTYSNASDAPDTTTRTIEFIADDGAGNGTPATRSVAVVAVNDAPVLTPASPSLAAVTEDDLSNGGVQVATLIGGSVSDADGGAVEGIAIVSLSPSSGTWQYSIDGGASWLDVGSVGVNSARLLRATDFVRFVPDGDNAESTGFGFRAWDQTSGTAGGFGDTTTNGGQSAFSSTFDAASISVTAVNDAPVLAPASPLMPTINEDDATNGGQQVGVLLGASVTDVDAGAVEGIVITGLTSGNGTWQYSLDGGTTWTDVGAVANNSALLLRDTDFIRFVPDGDNADSASFTYRSWDQTSGSAGTRVDTTTNGGTSAFSSASDTASITVTAVNDAATLTGLAGDSIVYAAGDGVVIVEQGGDAAVFDVDSTDFDGGSLTVAFLVGSDPAEDRLSIRNQGTGLGQIGFDGTNVTYQGLSIGTASGGSAGADLVIGLNANATPVAVAALIENVTYQNTDAVNPTTGARAIRFALDDGDGAVSAGYDVTINVPGVNTATILDRFGTEDYGNNDGSVNWSADWIENDSNGGGATDGRIEVRSGRLNFQVVNAGNFIYRAADLSSATSATLSFDYSNSLGGSATLHAQVSNDGGVTYTTVAVFDGSTNTGSGSQTIDITAFADADTRVRFLVVAGETGAGNHRLWIDNVQIEYDFNTDPVVTLPGGAVSFTENGAPVVVDGAASVTDAELTDFDGGVLTVDFTAGGTANDRLTVRNQGTGAGQVGLSGTDVTFGGVVVGTLNGGIDGATPLTITFNASADQAAVEAVARNITYQNVSDDPATGVRTVRFVLTDGDGGISSPATETITVTAVNDAPVLTPAAPSLPTVTEDDVVNGGQQISVLLGASVTDVDGGAVEGIAITGLSSGNGTWQYSLDGGTTWSDVGAVANNSALLLHATDFVRFVPDGQNADAASFTFRAWDQSSGSAGTLADTTTNGGTSAFSTATDSASITVTAVNDAPVLTPASPSLPTITEDDVSNGGQQVSVLLGASASDVDAGAIEGIAITGLSSGNGTWQYSLDGGTTWSGVGAVANNSALLLRATDFVRFVPDGQNADAASFTYRAWDQTSGVAGSLADTTANGTTTSFSTATDTASITITAVNDAPVLTPASPLLPTISEDDITNGGQQVGVLLGASVSDIDSGAVEGIAITSLTSSNGTWQYSLDGGTTWLDVGAVSNNSALLLRASDFVRFVPDGENADTASLTYRAWDQTSGSAGALADTSTNGGTSAFSSATDVASITVTPVNDAPVLAPASPALPIITEDDVVNGGQQVSVLLGGSVADVDSGAVEGIAVTGQSSGNGTWQYSLDGGTTWLDVGAVSNNSALLLRATDFIRFVPDGENADAAGFDYRAWDQSVGSAGSLADTTTAGGSSAFSIVTDNASVTITAVNDAPVLTPAAPTLPTITEDDVANGGQQVSVLLGGSVSEVDSGAVEGIAITGLTSSNGTWQYSLDGGASWLDVGTVADNSALLLRATDFIRFIPGGDNADTASFTYRAWDQTSGSAGALADTTTNGGTSAFSTATDSASITVTDVNDAPVLTAAAPALPTITEDDVANGGQQIGVLLDASVTDVDAGAVEGIAITGLTSGNGTWQYSLDGGAAWIDIGAVANNSALLLRATDFVRFVPDGDNADTASFTFRAWDQSGGSAGALADTTTHGGGSAFSTATDTASITTTAVNDAPVLTPSSPSLPAINEDDVNNSGEQVGVLLGVSVSDVDSGAVEGIAITGLVSGNGTWQYSLDGGATWLGVGAVSNSSALLLRASDFVRFVPDGINADSGSFSFRAWDQTVGTAGSLANASVNGGTTAFSGATDTASIIVSGVNEAPVLAPAAPALPAITEDDVANSGLQVGLMIGSSVSDVDNGAVEGIAITGLVSGNGTWQYSLDGGATWLDVGAVSNSNALLLRATDFVRFVPDAQNADAASLTYRAWDQTSGSSGSRADASTNGGSSAFSTATDSASINVTAVNDAPVLAPAAPTLASISEDDLNNSGQQVGVLLGASATDVDTGAVEGIAITSLSSGNGTWQYSLDGGTTWLDVGAVSNGSALLLRATDFVRFVPDGDDADSASFSFRAWDQSSGAAGTLADASTSGSTSAFSSAVDSATITVTAVNDAPVNRLPGQPQTIAGSNVDGATDVEAVDLDGDGDIDLVSTSWGDDRVTWFQNDGTGSFTEFTIATGVTGARHVFAADIDGDSHIDLLVSDFDNDTVTWYRNDGAATPSFTAQVITSSADGAWSTFAIDMDGDGDMDVLSASIWDDKVAWYENDGTAAPAWTEHFIGSADGARTVVAGDLDSDGDIDVATASFVDDTISWFENDGGATPTFVRNLVSTEAIGAMSIDIADVDADGHLDLVAASYFDNSISWFRNDGGVNPLFNETVIASSADGARDVTTADLDGDGDLDIVSASFLDDTFAWYENDGATTPTFVEHVISQDSDGPRGVAVADMDGDGDLDVAGASLNDGEVGFYENTDGRMGLLSIAEDTSLSFGTGTGNRIWVDDIDANGADLRVRLEITNGTITLSGVAGLTFSSGTGVADGIVEFRGSLADINAALNGMTFTPTADFVGVASIRIVSDDLGSTGSGGALVDDDTLNITVTAVNDAPILTPAAPVLPVIDEDDVANGGQQVGVLLGSSVADVDSGAVEGIAITGLTSGNGTWQYSLDGGASWLNVGVVSNSSALLLRATDFVRFIPDGDNGDAASFTYRAWDQTSGSAGALADAATNGGTTAFSVATDTASIAITAVNDAPVLTPASPALPAITEDDVANGGQQVSALLGSSVADIDSGAVDGIAITSLASGNGSWQYSLDGGSTWLDVGAVSDGSALLLRATDFVRFVPDAENADSASFSFRAWDQTSGVAGSLADASVSGGQSAFSMAIDNASISITAVNDAPILDASSPLSLSAVEDDDLNPAGDTVAALLASGGDRLTDVDSGAVEGIAVTGVDNSNGTWQYSLDNGSSWLDFGTPTVDSAVLLDAGDRIRFVSNSDYVGSAAATFLGWDQSSGAAGQTGVDASAAGGSSAFSLQTGTLTVSVTPGNSAPVAAAIAPVVVDEDAAPTVLNLYSIFDDAEDADAALTYSIVGNSNGALFNAVTTDAASGTLSLDYAANAFGTGTVTLRATDTDGAFVDATVFVTVNPVNDAPTASGIAPVVADEDAAPIRLDLRALFDDIEDGAPGLTFSVLTNSDPGVLTAAVDNPAGAAWLTPVADANGTVTLTVRATDSDGASVDANVVVTLNPINDAPQSSGLAPVTAIEDAADVLLDLYPAFSDIDDPVRALTFTVSGSDTLVTATVDQATGRLRLSFATEASGTSSLTVRAADASGAFVETLVDVVVTPADDAAQVSVPDAQATNEGSVLLLSAELGNAIWLEDVDGGETSITLSVANGTLSLATVAGLQFDDGSGSGDASMTFSGNIEDINAALDGLRFQSNGDFEGFVEVRVATKAAGDGGAPSVARFGILVVGNPELNPAPRPDAPPSRDTDSDSDDSTAAQDADAPAGTPAIAAFEAPEPMTFGVLDTSAPLDVDVQVFRQAIEALRDDIEDNGDASTLKADSHLSSITRRLLELGTRGQPAALIVSDAVFDALDALKKQLDASGDNALAETELVVTVASGITLSLSAGFVTWLMRAGSLLTSLLSTTPVWRGFDPLPVLGSGNDEDEEFFLDPSNARPDDAEALFQQAAGEAH